MVARFFWAREFLEFESSLFHALGINENWKYIFTIPLAALFYFNIFQKEKYKAGSMGKPVVRKSILIGAVLIILAVTLYLVAWI